LINQYPRGTSYHEAGHAVVAWSLGLRVEAISVRSEDAGGGAEIGPADHLSLVEQIAVCCAGCATEEAFEYQAHELASFMDMDKIREILEGNGIPEGEEALSYRSKGYERARSLLEINRDKVIKSAERLVECGHIGADEFLRLMNA
jgi:ATP-dependent Zn protease